MASGRPAGATIAAAIAPALSLVHRFAQFHRSLRESVGLGLDILDFFGLDCRLQARDRVLDGGAFGIRYFRAMLGNRLLGRMDQRVAMVLGLGEFAGLLVFGGMGFGFLDHLVDVGFREARRGLGTGGL